MSTRARRTGIAALAVAACASFAAAQEGAQAPLPSSPEEQKMLEAMEAAVRPGPEHAWLASTAGNWDVSITFWMTRGAEPMVSKGSAERTMMLGGRVLVEKAVGELMGAPFEAHRMAGFDKGAKKYWGTWNDNMMTGLLTSTGTCDTAGKCEHASWDPVSGQLKMTRMTSEHSGDREVHVTYEIGPDGKEFKVAEAVYTRKK